LLDRYCNPQAFQVDRIPVSVGIVQPHAAFTAPIAFCADFFGANQQVFLQGGDALVIGEFVGAIFVGGAGEQDFDD
jgi:hypothetical protein